KTAVSLSLRMRILRKIDRLAALSGSTRSEAVEKLALHSVDELIKEYSAKKS
ncbi:tellurium resistance protein TerW, partial [Escherichia coli]